HLRGDLRRRHGATRRDGPTSNAIVIGGVHPRAPARKSTPEFRSPGHRRAETDTLERKAFVDARMQYRVDASYGKYRPAPLCNHSEAKKFFEEICGNRRARNGQKCCRRLAVPIIT